MVDIEKFADEWGPEKVLQVYDPHTKTQGILVIDNTALGPCMHATNCFVRLNNVHVKNQIMN